MKIGTSLTKADRSTVTVDMNGYLVSSLTDISHPLAKQQQQISYPGAYNILNHRLFFFLSDLWCQLRIPSYETGIKSNEKANCHTHKRPATNVAVGTSVLTGQC